MVLAVGFGGWYYLNQQDQKASIQLNQAVRTLDTQLRPAGAPPDADVPSFTSARERTTEAHKQFQVDRQTGMRIPARLNSPDISSASLPPSWATMPPPSEIEECGLRPQ